MVAANYLRRLIYPLIALTSLIACTVVLIRSPLSAELFIEAPEGGDCKSLDGTWVERPGFPTCTIHVLTIQEDDTLVVRRGAVLVIGAQFVNFGSVFIRAGDPTGHAELTLGGGSAGAGAFVNYGGVFIVPAEEAASPGLNSHFFIHNNGLIANLVAGGPITGSGIGGIFNNFGMIMNRGQMANFGFFHNGEAATVSNIDSGFLTNMGLIENLGVIEGSVFGDCPGTCS